MVTVDNLVFDLLSNSFGVDFTLFAIFCLIIIGVMAYYFRIPYQLNLLFGWVLVYMFNMYAGGSSYILQMAFALISLGLGIMLVKGVLDYAKEWSQ